MNIGQLISFLILNSTKSNDEIVTIVHEKFEGCKTTVNSVAFYKTKLRKEGLLEKTKAAKFKIEMSEENLKTLCE
jgi:HKD family nuclease